MSGHVFVVGADLTRLACDDVLLPTDRSLRVTAGWRPLLPDAAVAEASEDDVRVDAAWRGDARVLLLDDAPSRRTWLVDTVGDEGRGLPWLLEGVREALAAVAAHATSSAAHGRARRLVALPALGTGWGVAAGSRGLLLERLLPVLEESARESGHDLALVLRSPSDLAAAQRVRRAAGTGFDDVPDSLREAAEALGERARAGSLAVFVGAGVSAAAGLPTWTGLLEELADAAGLDPALRRGVVGLPAQDAAALLARELGQERLASYVSARFGEQPHALAHSLVVGLPVTELVTTNFDPLLELAAAGAGKPLQVLPFEDALPDRPWLLKLHGDVARPDTVVLTREQYLRVGDHRAALTGVLHALLLTRHVLFVGSSMLDDDVIRVAHDVRSALRLPDDAAVRRTGTVLSLKEDAVRARLWAEDVETVAMAPADAPSAEAARRLEVFLDLVGCLACPPTGYLLDPAYRGLLDDHDAALAAALERFADDVPDDARRAPAWQDVAALLARLGSGRDSRERG